MQIEYQEPVRQSGDEFSLRVPLVVGAALQSRRRWCRPSTCVRRQRLGPRSPIRCRTATASSRRCSIRATHAPVNPVTITVRLQAGFPLGEVKSHHHAVKIETRGDDTRVIKLAEGPVPADRDFELTWKPAAGKAPSVGLFRERVGDADYLLAFVTPPALEQQPKTARRARSIFVIDNSGSMGGTSMVQAKASLIYALGRLQPDRPLQRDPLRRHDGHAVPRRRAGRRRACRPAPRPSSARSRPAAAPRWCRRCGGARPIRGASDASYRAPGRVPHRRRDRQRAAAVRHHRRRCAAARACSWSASARRRTPS